MRSSGSAVYGSDALGGVRLVLHQGPGRLSRRSTLPRRRQDALRQPGPRHQRQRRRRPAAPAACWPRCLSATAAATSRATRARSGRTARRARHSTRKIAAGRRFWASWRSQSPMATCCASPSKLTDTSVFTNAFSLRTAAAPDITSDDSMRRHRVSADQSVVGLLGADPLFVERLRSAERHRSDRRRSAHRRRPNARGQPARHADLFTGQLRRHAAGAQGLHRRRTSTPRCSRSARRTSITRSTCCAIASTSTPSPARSSRPPT